MQNDNSLSTWFDALQTETVGHLFITTGTYYNQELSTKFLLWVHAVTLVALKNGLQ